MSGYPVFDELQFLVDLQTQIQAAAALDDELQNSQIRLLDREPTEEDLYTMAPGTILIMPGGDWEPVHYSQELTRIEPYPVLFLVMSQTWDASAEADRWTDDVVGGARLRQALSQLLESLGPNEDGAFTLTAPRHLLNFVILAAMGRPARLLIGEGEEGTDLSVPSILAHYDIEVEAA